MIYSVSLGLAVFDLEWVWQPKFWTVLSSITWYSTASALAQILRSVILRSSGSFWNWTREHWVLKANKHPTIESLPHGYKSRKVEEFYHTYNALEQLWSRRQFSRSEANSPRTNWLSFACFLLEWVARC